MLYYITLYYIILYYIILYYIILYYIILYYIILYYIILYYIILYYKPHIIPLTHRVIIKNFGHGSVDKVCAMGGGVIGGVRNK